MEKDRIYEHLKARINKIIIDEQFGVSDELDAKVNEVYRQVVKSLAKQPIVISDDGNKQRTDCIEIDFFGKKLKIQTTNYIFRNEKEYEVYKSKNGIVGGYRTFSFPIEVSLISIGDEDFLSDFRDTLGHELEHAYQDAKTGKTNSKILSSFQKDRLFNYVCLYINSSNLAERNAARCIYASNPQEQSAFLFGMYQDFKSNPLRNVDTVIQNSEATVWLKNAYESYTYVYNHRDDAEIEKALKKYYKKETNSLINKNDRNSFSNVNQFLKFVQNGIKKYEWRYARMVYHCKQKFYYGCRPINAKYLDEQRENIKSIYILK